MSGREARARDVPLTLRVRNLSVVLAIAVVVVSGCSAGSGPDRAAQPIAVVTPATFEAKVGALRGKPVVVNFWATWCDPCKAEMPRLAGAATRYAGRVHFVGVDVQDDATAAGRFAAKNRVPYRSVADPRREVVSAQKILGLPVTQFYSARGVLIETHQGEIKSDELTDAIQRVLRAR